MHTAQCTEIIKNLNFNFLRIDNSTKKLSTSYDTKATRIYNLKNNISTKYFIFANTKMWNQKTCFATSPSRNFAQPENRYVNRALLIHYFTFIYSYAKYFDCKMKRNETTEKSEIIQRTSHPSNKHITWKSIKSIKSIIIKFVLNKYIVYHNRLSSNWYIFGVWNRTDNLFYI